MGARCDASRLVNGTAFDACTRDRDHDGDHVGDYSRWGRPEGAILPARSFYCETCDRTFVVLGDETIGEARRWHDRIAWHVPDREARSR